MWEVSLDLDECEKRGFGFDDLADAICYISNGIEFLAKYQNDAEQIAECASWVASMRDAMACIAIG